jgi:hypothetical protein
MRKTVIGAAAAATVAVTGLAFAQEGQSGQEQKHAAGQIERGQSNHPAAGATGKEGAAAPAQGQMGEERQGQGGKMGGNAQERNKGPAAGQGKGGTQTRQREGQAGMQNNQRQGEARSNEAQTQKEQTGQGGKQEHDASPAQTERSANTREPGKREGQNGARGAQNREGQQRAGETNRTENGQATQTERKGMQGNAAERGGVTQQNREGAAGQTATSPNRKGMAHEDQTPTTAGTNGGAATVEARGNAHLSNEQASRIGDTLWRTASPAQTSVNIDVNVGELLPGNLELMPLPPAVVSIVPEYRDYDYVVVHDEIVIVQPSTRKIVEIIQRGGETHAMREGVSYEHRLTLSQSQQRLIRDTVTRDHLPAAQVQEQLTYGVTVPQDVTLEPVPQPLIVQIPMIEQYRMFITGDDRIVLVDPDTREVVDVIE